MITGEVVGGAVAFVAVAVAGGGGAVVTGRRVRRSRDTAADAYVRPLLFAAMDRESFDDDVVERLTRAQHRALEVHARSLLPNLRGRDRDVLGGLLEHLGAVDEARQRSHSKRARARAQAGEFLGHSGSPSAVRDLVELLHDPDVQVRWSAARGLGRLGHPSALSPLLASIDGPRPVPVDVVADAVFQIHNCPMAVLRQGVRSRSVPTRAVTVELLGRFQALVAIDEVIEVLRSDPSVEVRARAARALGRMGSPRAVQALLACVDAGPAAMRIQAVWALGEIGSAQAVPALRVLLVGPSPRMAETAGEALAAIGESGVRVLHQVAEGDGPPALAAAHALAGVQPTLH